MRKGKNNSRERTQNLILGFGEEIALLGIMWALLFANPTATNNLLIGLGITLPYFPFAVSVLIITLLVGYYVFVIGALKENIRKSKRGVRG